MAYQIKRNKSATEELELVDETGKVAKTILIRLDRAGIIQDINRKVIDLVHADAAVKAASATKKEPEQMTEAYKNLESAALTIMRVIFGDEDAQAILDFYGGNVFEMMNEVTPFLMQVVIPKMREIAKEAKKNKMRSYDRKRPFLVR